MYALPADIIGTPKAVFIASDAGTSPQTEFELYYVDQPRLLTDYETVYIDYIEHMTNIILLKKLFFLALPQHLLIILKILKIEENILIN